jgi:hypothetical protein
LYQELAIKARAFTESLWKKIKKSPEPKLGGWLKISNSIKAEHFSLVYTAETHPVPHKRLARNTFPSAHAPPTADEKHIEDSAKHRLQLHIGSSKKPWDSRQRTPQDRPAENFARNECHHK